MIIILEPHDSGYNASIACNSAKSLLRLFFCFGIVKYKLLKSRILCIFGSKNLLK
jgi:hypothetical protein